MLYFLVSSVTDIRLRWVDIKRTITSSQKRGVSERAGMVLLQVVETIGAVCVCVCECVSVWYGRAVWGLVFHRCALRVGLIHNVQLCR